MLAKIVLLGQGGVGKSTIRERYLGIAFRPAYLQTVGTDFTMKTQIVNTDTSIVLQIWDLAGQQGFSNVREAFYRGTDGAVLIFDVTKPDTAESIVKYWVKELKANLNMKIPLLLVGNKIDLREDNNHSISYDEGVKLAKKISKTFNLTINYIESSAKTGQNVDLIFSSIATDIVNVKNQFKKFNNEKDFDKYYNEFKDHVQLYFFKMLDDGPYCISKTIEFRSEEFLTKMAIYYSTALGQGAIEHTGLFGPFPIPITDIENKNESNKNMDQAILYSFKKADRTLTDIRAKGINFCFFVLTIPKEIVYQMTTNAVNRFFYDKLDLVEDVDAITDSFLIELKTSLLKEVSLIN